MGTKTHRSERAVPSAKRLIFFLAHVVVKQPKCRVWKSQNVQSGVIYHILENKHNEVQ